MSRAVWWELAESQAGAITVGQMVEAGVSRAGQARLLREGTVRRGARGVLVVGTAERDGASFGRRLWVAVLVSGPSAVAFRRSAAAWWGLDGVPADVVEVGLPAGRQSRAVVA